MKGLFFALPFVVGGCTLLSAGSASSSAALDRIQSDAKTAYGQPAEAVYRYEYKGRTVFLTIPPCCDHYALLFDEMGKSICSPSGGFTGKGDGKCPDFQAEKKNETLVFKKK